jgi:hypothetical protein
MIYLPSARSALCRSRCAADTLSFLQGYLCYFSVPSIIRHLLGELLCARVVAVVGALNAHVLVQVHHLNVGPSCNG